LRYVRGRLLMNSPRTFHTALPSFPFPARKYVSTANNSMTVRLEVLEDLSTCAGIKHTILPAEQASHISCKDLADGPGPAYGHTGRTYAIFLVSAGSIAEGARSTCLWPPHLCCMFQTFVMYGDVCWRVVRTCSGDDDQISSDWRLEHASTS
jgi:hypothetical protein